MKALYILITFFILSQLVFGQNDLVIIKKMGTKYSEKEINESINKADWCGFIHKDSLFTLSFDDGLQVMLKSQKQLLSENQPFSEECIQKDNTKDSAIYSIHQSGVLMRRVEKNQHVKSINH